MLFRRIDHYGEDDDLVIAYQQLASVWHPAVIRATPTGIELGGSWPPLDVPESEDVIDVLSRVIDHTVYLMQSTPPYVAPSFIGEPDCVVQHQEQHPGDALPRTLREDNRARRG